MAGWNMAPPWMRLAPCSRCYRPIRNGMAQWTSAAWPSPLARSKVWRKAMRFSWIAPLVRSTVRSTSIFDANIELTPRSQRIEIQLIVEAKDPITYEIVLDRVASSSSKSPNFAMSIALGFCILLIAMYFLIFKRRRHDEK